MIKYCSGNSSQYHYLSVCLSTFHSSIIFIPGIDLSIIVQAILSCLHISNIDSKYLQHSISSNTSFLQFNNTLTLGFSILAYKVQYIVSFFFFYGTTLLFMAFIFTLLHIISDVVTNLLKFSSASRVSFSF